MGNRPAASPRARSSCLFGRLVCDITRKESRMKPISVIPCLDMLDGRVVKGVNFVGLRDAGDPVENARFYDAEGADELAMLDIAATLEGRANRVEWARSVAAVIDIPLTVGGGISSLDDMRDLFKVGVAKVSMNSAAVKDPGLVREAAVAFGGDRVVVAIDGRRNAAMPSGFEVVSAAVTRAPASIALSGPPAARSLARVRCCRQAWTATALWPATTSRSPKPSPMR